MKKDAVVETFQSLWSSLFNSQVHLDSALSKIENPRTKSVLAQIVPTLLLRPASQAEALGIGIGPEEPWGLTPAQIAKWKAATLIVERVYEAMSGRKLDTVPMIEDFPPKMLAEWREYWGEETKNELIDILGREAPLSLRTTRKFGPKVVLKALTDGSRLPVSAELSPFAPMGVRLGGYAPVLQTELYDSGAFEIQDEGSQLMSLFALWPEKFAPLLSDKPGPVKVPKNFTFTLPENPPAWNVVDACAGAGGKSLALSDALGGKGRIYAYDISEGKLRSLRRRAKHAGFNNIQAVALVEGSEAEVISKFRRRADVVLVDAPCSGWGVLRRNPDIKWRQTPEVLERMPLVQGRILAQYSDLVAPGGRLVFGVCTFRPAETTEVVKSFLLHHPDFKAEQGGYFGPGPCDGFFMQAFTRAPKAK